MDQGGVGVRKRVFNEQKLNFGLHSGFCLLAFPNVPSGAFSVYVLSATDNLRPLEICPLVCTYRVVGLERELKPERTMWCEWPCWLGHSLQNPL